MSKKVTPEPSRQLLNQIKAHFVLHGETMAAWCRVRGIRQCHAREAVLGSWNGPAGRALRESLCREAGLVGTKKAQRSVG